SRVLAASIHREDALCRWIVDDRVRIGSCLYRGHSLQRVQIKNGDGVRAPVAGEPASRIGRYRDSMHTLRVGNVANDFAAVGIEHHNVSPMRDVDATSSTVHSHIIPTIVATNGEGLRYAVASIGRFGNV